MSRDYWLGLATLPAGCVAGLVLIGLYLLLFGRHSQSSWVECPHCSKKWRSAAWEPWWKYSLRTNIGWRRHMRDSPTCRERTNFWLAKKGETNKRWTNQGRLRMHEPDVKP